MSKLYPLLMISVLACVPAQTLPAPKIPEINRPERISLPPDPEDEPLPAGVPNQNWIRPVEKGSCDKSPSSCPDSSGLMSSEARAFRDGMYRLRYRELKTNYQQDRLIWDIQRQYYERDAAKMEHDLSILRPGILDRYGLPLGVVGGFVIGISISTLFLWILQK